MDKECFEECIRAALGYYIEKGSIKDGKLDEEVLLRVKAICLVYCSHKQ